MNTTKLPKCKLTGTDGNVFAIMSKVSKTLKQAGYKVKADEFVNKAMCQNSYEDVLVLCSDYVDVYSRR